MLKMVGIDKSFNIGTINEKQIFKGLNLTINDGDFITVIGGNGAGKSTMLNLIAGVHKADGGRIFLDNEDLTYKNETQRAKYIGRVFQDPMMGTAPSMMIEENQLGLGLEDRMKTKVGLLSGGQRQAVTLLMATLQKPRLLLLDEHTAALDPATSAKVLTLSDQIIHDNALTALMVTHNMQDAITYGNRLIMMDKGRVILDISGEEKKHLTIEDLLHKFEEVSGSKFTSDSVILG